VVSRLPLRVRLTAGFALAMALVLAGAGYLTVSRFQETQQEYPDAGTPAAQQGALADLRTELLIALPLVLVIATLGAYLLAAAALRPVERLRAQAAAITDATAEHRLDVPPGRDEIARLAVTLNDMLGRLQATFERERRFVADASHELRTPLSLLQTELDLALRRPRGAADLTAALSSAREETGRLVQLAEDLLLLARTDQASGPGGGPVVPLAPLLDRLAGRYEPAITVDCPPGLSVQVDLVRIERAVTNLIDNAQRHGRPPVTLTVRSVGDQMEIRVRDHGPGFPPEFLPHAFERFSRADVARTGTGTGLGLAIAAAVTTSSGGRHGAANHPDGGAEVWLRFP
jgi:signal transduction histidine kinase